MWNIIPKTQNLTFIKDWSRLTLQPAKLGIYTQLVALEMRRETGCHLLMNQDSFIAI